MVYETRLKSTAQLWRELVNLEVDAGVRALGTFEGKKSFVFITKHSGRYSVWVRPRSGPVKSGSILEFTSVDELRSFLNGLLDSPLKAHMY